jgi:pseudouridine synthase
VVRLQKFLAQAGVASRRASEQLILDGRIAVNGKPVKQLGVKVDPSKDRIALDGRVLKVRCKLHLALNKPRGYLCTCRDTHGRRILADLLPKEWHDLYPVGRLDFETEGLIFLTNDGDFCLRLTHPRFGLPKTYRVTVEGCAAVEVLRQMERGVYHNAEWLRVQRARILSRSFSHSLLELELAEGKNREVRRLCAALGLRVKRLQRVRIGPIALGQLPVGKWRTLSQAEVQSLWRHCAPPAEPGLGARQASVHLARDGHQPAFPACSGR